MRINSLLPPLVSALVVSLTGCATTPPPTAMLTYQSVPDGAEIFEGGKSLGVVPVARTYNTDGKSNSIRTPDVRAVWPSGAETTFYTFLTAGADRVATLERPASAPGLQVDLDHAGTLAATRQREAERLKDLQKKDIARASDRCKQQQAGTSTAVSDDCN
ncbi:MAG TPA: hypothetical protein VK130_06775 [Steroidobacteraceae bacterium]|nr:hypothetical protein [Steroidobacteraceae bacterium]